MFIFKNVLVSFTIFLSFSLFSMDQEQKLENVEQSEQQSTLNQSEEPNNQSSTDELNYTPSSRSIRYKPGLRRKSSTRRMEHLRLINELQSKYNFENEKDFIEFLKKRVEFKKSKQNDNFESDLSELLAHLELDKKKSSVQGSGLKVNKKINGQD